MHDQIYELCPRVDPQSDLREIDVLLSEAARNKQAITMMNYFSEMPVVSRSMVSVIDKGRIEVNPKDIHMVVLSRQNMSFVTLPRGDTLLAECHGVYPGKGFAVLAQFSFVTLKAGMRESLRVGFERPINVVLLNGDRKIPAILHNISLGGASVSLFARDLCPGVDLKFYFKSFDREARQVDEFTIPATVVRVSGEKIPHFCGLKFAIDSSNDTLLANYINRKQMEIIYRLRNA